MNEFNQQQRRLDALYGFIGFACASMSIVVLVLRIIVAIAN
jgi:hypothetical protein